MGDKLKHFLGCAALMGLGLIVGGPHTGPIIGGLLVAAAALGREAYNRKRGGKFDWRDIGAGVMGGLVMLVGFGLIYGALFGWA